MVRMFLTVKQKILITLLDNGPLQNNDIAKHVGITEQWCSQTLSALHADSMIEIELIPPRKINKLTNKGAKVAKHLKEISQKTEAKNH
jgi:DNA-binding HxlR family transcriptional regulator